MYMALSMPVCPPEPASCPQEGSSLCLGQMHTSQGNSKGEVRAKQAAESGSANCRDRMSPVTIHSPMVIHRGEGSSVDGPSRIQLAFSSGMRDPSIMVCCSSLGKPCTPAKQPFHGAADSLGSP